MDESWTDWLEWGLSRRGWSTLVDRERVAEGSCGIDEIDDTGQWGTLWRVVWDEDTEGMRKGWIDWGNEGGRGRRETRNEENSSIIIVIKKYWQMSSIPNGSEDDIEGREGTLARLFACMTGIEHWVGQSKSEIGKLNINMNSDVT